MRTITFFIILTILSFVAKGQTLVAYDFTLSDDKTSIVFSLTNHVKNPIIIKSCDITGEDQSFCQITYKEDTKIKHTRINLCNNEKYIIVKPSDTYTYKIDITHYTEIIEAKCFLRYILITDDNKGGGYHWSKTIKF